MSRWTKPRRVVYGTESRVSVTVHLHRIMQTQHTPGPHQQYFLEYLHEKFRKEWPKYYAKAFGKSKEQTQSKASG
jgi:hypothetical protein